MQRPLLGSRLGPSRAHPQDSPSSHPIRFLDSAPATTPQRPAAANSTSAQSGTDHDDSHTPSGPLLPAGYYAMTPANGTPYGVANIGLTSEAAHDDEEAGRHLPNGLLLSQHQGSLFATARAGGSQQAAPSVLSLPAHEQDRPAAQQPGEDRSRASVLKRLAAKRHAMGGGLLLQSFTPDFTPSLRSTATG